MNTRHSRSIIAIVLMQLLCLQALASECPVVNPPDKLFDDDKACLAILDKNFASYSPDINFEVDRNAMLTVHYDADQQFVLDTFYVRYCELVGEPRWQLSDDARRKKLNVAKEALYAHVPFPPPLVNTVHVSFLRTLPKTYLVGGSDDRGVGPTFASLFAPHEEAIELNEPDGLDEGDAERQVTTTSNFIRELPYVVNKANKHFVMVASVGSPQDAINEAKRLKRRAPQFDFVAYSPYAGNPSYAIMMATWVPWTVAKQALADAQKYVNSGSLIWSCRKEGSNC